MHDVIGHRIIVYNVLVHTLVHTAVVHMLIYKKFSAYHCAHNSLVLCTAGMCTVILCTIILPSIQSLNSTYRAHLN